MKNGRPISGSIRLCPSTPAIGGLVRGLASPQGKMKTARYPKMASRCVVTRLVRVALSGQHCRVVAAF